MELLFFNSTKNIEEISKEIEKCLRLPEFIENDSVNVLYGTYFTSTCLNMKIKLEANSYDYEDDYNYMMTVKEDFLSEINTSDELILNFTKIIGKILSLNMKIKVAHEIKNILIIYGSS